MSVQHYFGAHVIECQSFDTDRHVALSLKLGPAEQISK